MLAEIRCFWDFVACFDFTLEMLSIASTKTCIWLASVLHAANEFLAVNVGCSNSSSSRRVHQKQKQQ